MCLYAKLGLLKGLRNVIFKGCLEDKIRVIYREKMDYIKSSILKKEFVLQKRFTI